jgi:peptidoglycan/LPS O-acetylase OafA/YrhL
MRDFLATLGVASLSWIFVEQPAERLKARLDRADSVAQRAA